MNPIDMSREKSALATLALLGAGLVLPMIAASAARRLAGLGYRMVTDEDPPRNPAAREVEWRDAIVWSVVSGAIGGLARLSVRRVLAPSDIPAEGYDFKEKAEELID